MILYYILIISLPLAEQWLFAYRIAGFTVDKYLGAVCLLYAFFYLTTRRSVPRIFASAQTKAFLVFYLIALFSWFTQRIGEGSNDTIIAFTSHMLFLFMTITVLDSPWRIRRSLFMGIIAIGVVSQYVLREWRYGLSAYGTGYRPGTVGGGPDVFSASTLIFLPVGFFLLGEARSRWERFLILGCLTLGMAAVMVAASRGALVGLIATVLLIVARSRNRVRNFVVVGSIIAVSLVAFPNSPLRRAIYPSRADLQSSDLHHIVWKAGIRMALRHPLMGVGLGNFKYVVDSYADQKVSLIAHNTYIEMAAETGFPGLLAYLAMLFFTFRSLERSRKRAYALGERFSYFAATGLQVGLCGFCVCQLFVSAEFMKLFWFAVFMSAVLEASTSARARRAAAEEQYEVSPDRPQESFPVAVG